MKRGFCEFCPAVGDECGICDAFARWEDDGGAVGEIDHDAETKEAETLPEMAALTSWELRPVVTTWHQRATLGLSIAVVACAWTTALVLWLLR